MEVLAPRDGFVTSILKQAGPIAQHDVIVELSADEEDLIEERLKLAADLMTLQEQSVEPNEVRLQRRVFEIAVEITEKYVAYAEAKLGYEQQQIARGAGSALVVKQAEAACAKANGEREKAKLSLESYDKSVLQARTRYSLLKTHVASEAGRLAQKRSRLRLVSPFSGHVEVLVAVGGFCLKGSAIARVT